MMQEHDTATSQWHEAPSNDTPWGPEVDAGQDRDADEEWTPPPKCCGHGRRIGHCDWCETLNKRYGR
jgi:hypothetical protein